VGQFPGALPERCPCGADARTAGLCDPASRDPLIKPPALRRGLTVVHTKLEAQTAGYEKPLDTPQPKHRTTEEMGLGFGNPLPDPAVLHHPLARTAAGTCAHGATTYAVVCHRGPSA